MILLDTHTLLWWSGQIGSRLSERAFSLIEEEKAKTSLLVSTISMWEITMLCERGRLGLKQNLDDWLRELEGNPFVKFIPIDNRIAVEANRLPDPFHRDPADRLIVATARLLDIPLLTADTKILDYPFVRNVW
ncbi:type II toxin-antitoxin system VapC family toxin [Tianweitania populi]|uniref:Twitching motility protein PilT n=1 Tax=Tianweitania populi TaxID=1607949 RepID=A0A8J3DYA5_9HYPH|nr:type II toxin-antitoxin system VapC family toxin [Tianweitania populi]GHD18652.1 twitching motility protein PilT [Tianweitania populi]